MSHEYVVNLPYTIKYNTAEHVPIDEVISALSSLHTLLASASSVISGISNIEIQGQQLYVQKIESGSLLEDFSVRLIFGDKEKQEEFLRWLDGTKNMRNILIGAILGGALAYGVTVLTKNNDAITTNNGSSISNSPNSMIINFPAGSLDDATRKTINDEIAKRVTNKNEIAKQTLNFFKPIHSTENASISLGDGGVNAEITSLTVKSIPSKYVAKKNNRYEDLSQVVVLLRATDLDSKKTGWAGSIQGVTNRVKLEMDPTIEPTEIYGKTKITADVTLERDFNPKDNAMVPKRIIIRAIH